MDVPFNPSVAQECGQARRNFVTKLTNRNNIAVADTTRPREISVNRTVRLIALG
jgi:hypothetical protein